MTYINDAELHRARAASRAIEEDAIAEDPKIDRDRLFDEADTRARGRANQHCLSS